MSFKITQRMVTQYGKYRALKNLIDAWCEKQRALILAAMERGQGCPDRGPYIFVVTQVSESLSWKEEFIKYLRAQGESEARVAEIMQGISERERPTAARLDCKKNPNYRRDFPIRLP